MHQLLLLRSHSDFAELKASSRLQEALERVITQRLLSGRFKLENLAEALDMPVRTLQLRLEHQGLNYRSVLDKVRLGLAQNYLKDPDLPMIKIAEFLGYSEQSPFQKAFKRWTGKTPGEYRKRATELQ